MDEPHTPCVRRPRIDLTEGREGRKEQQPIFAYLSVLLFKKGTRHEGQPAD